MTIDSICSISDHTEGLPRTLSKLCSMIGKVSSFWACPDFYSIFSIWNGSLIAFELYPLTITCRPVVSP